MSGINSSNASPPKSAVPLKAMAKFLAIKQSTKTAAIIPIEIPIFFFILNPYWCG